MSWVLPAVDEWVRPGTGWWWCGVVAALVARGADMLSTWIATPRLELEGNPVARWMGWRRGVWLNLLVVPCVACWPMLAVSLATTSAMVAARNLQMAWLMRTMGEGLYQIWFSDRVHEASRGLVLGCHLGEAFLAGGVGVLLVTLGPSQVVSFGVGVGLCAYGFAIAAFTGWSLLRPR